MNYTYAYKTSDGMRHEDTMQAASRDEVFAALRKRGIKAIKVVAADGAKANGELRGVRKRVVAIFAACLVVGAIVAAIMAFRAGENASVTRGMGNDAQGAISAPRHQIYGDPVIIEEFERGDFTKAFTNRCDQMLAWFAQPGRLMCPRGTVPNRLAADFEATVATFKGTVPSPIKVISAEDSREIRELKQIVNGLWEEMGAYLANGNGTPRSYWRRLLQRTQQEMQIYERTRRELEKETNPEVFEQKNQALRNLGLRTIPKAIESEE